MMFLSCGLVSCSAEQEPLRASDSSTMVSIETVYGMFNFPEDRVANLKHVEVTEGNVAMEVFYMVDQGGEKELFRVYFADPQMGNHMGYFSEDGKEIPITYSLCEYEDSTFSSEEERRLYYSMMEGISILMNSIYEDDRFSEIRTIETVGNREIKLRYWKVELPDNVQYVETEEDGVYCVNFYGEAGGEKINLYMIALGNIEVETILGWYTVDGRQLPVGVRTFNIEAYDSWSKEDRIVLSNMMNSLNTVINGITGDKNFSMLESEK